MQHFLVAIGLLYLSIGYVNGSANIHNGKTRIIRRLLWTLFWLPIFVADVIVMKKQSHFLGGRWDWL